MKHEITDLEITDIEPYSNAMFDGIQISWCANIGWGQCTFFKEKGDDQWTVDTERMSSNEDKTFLKMLLDKLADMAEVTG